MHRHGDWEGGFVGGNRDQAAEVSEPWGQGSLERGQNSRAVSWGHKEGRRQINTQDDAAQQQEEEQPQ